MDQVESLTAEARHGPDASPRPLVNRSGFVGGSNSREVGVVTRSRLTRDADDVEDTSVHRRRGLIWRHAPENTLPNLRDAIAAAAASCGAFDVRLFGSAARGEERSDSDVDFIVRLEPGRTLLDLVRLETRLEDLFGRPVDVVTEASLAEPMRSRALAEAVRV